MISNLKADWLRLDEGWLTIEASQAQRRYGSWESCPNRPCLMLSRPGVVNR